MATVQKKKTRSWGHNLREENSGLREKIAALRKETARLKKDLEKAWELMAHVPGGLFLLQRETIVYANKAACGWLGYSLEELAGKACWISLIRRIHNPSMRLFKGKPASKPPVRYASKTVRADRFVVPCTSKKPVTRAEMHCC